MKKIPLTHGKFAIVDDDDFDFITRLKPALFQRKYQKEDNRTEGKCWELVLPGGHGVSTYYVKHFLLRPKQSSLVVAAKNGNNLDLRKENLMVMSRAVSLHHNLKRKKTSSQYKGVYFLSPKKYRAARKWMACINGPTHTKPYKKNRIYLGVFSTENEAAEAYNKKALELYGEFAYQNKIE